MKIYLKMIFLFVMLGLIFTPLKIFASNITGSLDSANSNSQIIGWALDQTNQSSALSVLIYIDGAVGAGQLAGTVTANVPRPDLNTAGVVGDHGYQLNIPDQYKDGQVHQVYTYVGSQLLPGSPKSFTITPNLTGAVDTISSTIGGWALDQNNQTAAISVSFYADGDMQSGKLMGTIQANSPSPDLNQVGVAGNHRFLFTVPSQYKDGQNHSLSVYAVIQNTNKLISTSTQRFNLNQNYKGNLESVGDLITGWALNDDIQSQTVNVTFYLDGSSNSGTNIGTVLANIVRADLNTAGYQGNHGFSFVVPSKFRDGKSHQVYAYASNTLLSSSPMTGNFSCSFSNCSNLQIQSGGNITVQAIGSPQIIYNYSQDRCNDGDIPDSPVRAFRDSNGQVNLITGNTTNYRMIGSSLDAVKKNCTPVMQSANDSAYNNGDYHEWISSVYTPDGKIVYALVHNEWYAQLIDSRCNSPLGGWLNFITLAQSVDAGATYVHPGNYIIMKPSAPWSTSFNCTPPSVGAVGTSYNAFEPSNFVKKDGYYYAFYRSEADPLGVTQAGACLMRTSNLGDVNSYQLWSGNAWTSATSTYCKPIELPKLEKMHESLTYNSYLKAYILVGLKFNPTSGPGVYFSTSQDLLSWTEPQKIIALSSGLSLSNGQGRLIYPSLLDPTDSSLNFENTGQDPYLYFSVDNGTSNRDLVRQKIHFTRLTNPSTISTPSTTQPTLSNSNPTTTTSSLAIPIAPPTNNLTYPTGSLVVDSSGTIYLIIGSSKIPFTNWTSFVGLGYSLRNVVKGDVLNYTLPQTYIINSPSQEHPWGSWLLYGTTIYYSHESGMIPVTSWNYFINNGGQAKFVIKANKADTTVIQNNSLPFLQSNDNRIYK